MVDAFMSGRGVGFCLTKSSWKNKPILRCSQVFHAQAWHYRGNNDGRPVRGSRRSDVELAFN